ITRETTHVKSASDEKTSVVVTTNHGALVVNTTTNDELTTTAAADLANAPTTITTSPVTRITTNDSITIYDAVPFTKDAAISERGDGAIANSTAVSARVCVAATS